MQYFRSLLAASASLAPLTSAYIGNNRDATVGLTTYTFTSEPIGTADANRRVIVCVAGDSGTAPGDVSSMTVGGISATLVNTTTYSGGTQYLLSMWYADVPTGTTANIVVTYNHAQYMSTIAVYTTQKASTVSVVGTENTTSPMATSVEVLEGSSIISVAFNVNTPTFVWTNLTEDFEAVTNPSGYWTGAHDDFASYIASRTITCTPSPSWTVPIIIAAVFSPA